MQLSRALPSKHDVLLLVLKLQLDRRADLLLLLQVRSCDNGSLRQLACA